MPRPRANPIKVFVTAEEREKIVRLAASSNLSLSAYMRAAGLNRSVRAILDIDAVKELAQVNGDLGRAAVLLKDLMETGALVDAKKTIEEFRNLQTQIHQIMGRIVR